MRNACAGRRSRVWRSSAAVVVVAGLALGGAGCGSSNDAQSAGKAPLTKLTFRGPFTTSGGDAPFYYAKKLGYFAQEGIDLKITDSGGSAQTIADVARGGSDIGEVDATGAMLAISKGQPLKVVATTLGRSSFGFFVPKNSGISSVKGLAGKSVEALALVSPNMYAALAAGGVSKGQVKPVFADATALIPAYLSGKVDAMYSSELLAGAVQQRRPSDVLLQASVGYNPPDFVLIVKDSTLASKAALIRGFVRATLRGWMAARANPKAAIDALLEKHPEVGRPIGTGVLMATFSHLCSAAQKGKPYGMNAPRDWSASAAALKRFAGLQGSTDASRFITNQFFEGDHAIDAGRC